MWKTLETIGTLGSELGQILLDEEYKESARITLEKCERYYAITCGIYGAMVHTTFVSENKHLDMYNNMKTELQDFIDRETTQEEEIAFYEYFTEKYI